MLAEERRFRIREILTGQRTVTATQLTQILGVTAATIRRDLASLESEGVLLRSHGGAVSRTSSTNFQLSYDALLRTNSLEKAAIAREADSLILDGETVFLEGSSTVYELAKLLQRRTRLTVVTNSPPILAQLQPNPGITVMCTGGDLQKDTFYLSGVWAERVISEIRVDKAIIGVSALDPAYGFSAARQCESQIKKLLAKAAKQRIALADHSKFGKQSFSFVGPASGVDVVITDSKTSPKYVEGLRQDGLEVIVAPLETEEHIVKSPNRDHSRKRKIDNRSKVDVH
jgi:DeoR family transcriptional regulator, fructose operon transcriptional repressor